MDPEARKAHCRKIAALGGKATYEKHGKEHMAKIGKAGFLGLYQRLGDYGQAVNFLVSRGQMPKGYRKNYQWHRPVKEG